MMVCGLKKSSVLFSFNLAVLLTIGGVNSFTVIRSTTRNGNGDVDRFTNPSCHVLRCERAFSGSVCSTVDCCSCRCAYLTPNYVINEWSCRASDEIDEGCQFTTTQGEDVPLSVNEITKTGKVQFRTPGICNGAMQVTMWSYRLTGYSWIPGSPNVFKVANVAGDEHSWVLQWNRGLDAKYTGLILKIDFSCGNIYSGCLLTKSKGNYTFSNTAPSDVAVDARGGKTGPTLQSGTAAGTNGQKTNERTNDVRIAAETKREVEAKQTGIVIAGVTVSLAAGIVLVLATLLLMKRKHGDGRTKGPRRNGPNVSYEEPITPSARPGVTLRAATFLENAFYSSDCVLSISTQNAESTDTMATRPSRLGPLPALPTQEGIYEEPKITRNVAYHHLAKDSQDNNGTVDNVIASEQQSLPVYNVLEPATNDDGDYDDNVAVDSRNSNA